MLDRPGCISLTCVLLKNWLGWKVGDLEATLRQSFVTAFFGICAVGCVSATTASPFEFSPTASPLHYDVNMSGDVIANTPMGRMTSETESDATLVLNIGEKLENGRSVTATFEELEVRAEGSLGGGTVNAEGILGKPFSGTLLETGQITITDSPQASGRLRHNLDPAALLTELLAPLPPGGATDMESWPVVSSVVSEAAVRLTSSFVGTARFAGDTVWNGVDARLIVVEGMLEIDGSGAPAGAPAEMNLLLEGESTRLYVWDMVRRVMLASLVTGEAEGSLSISGMDFQIPARFVSRQEVELRR